MIGRIRKLRNLRKIHQVRRLRTLRAAAVLALVGALALALPAEAGAAPESLRILVEGGDGGRVDIELPAGWVTRLLAAATVDCREADDARMRRMAADLERQGEGGVHVFRGRDEREVVGRRVRGALKIETRDDDGERVTVEMPWVLAQCFLLGEPPREGIARALARSGLRVRVDGAGRKSGRVLIDLD
jgi:hypothetical protein